MASILLTGGAGFIGSHVAEALLAAGHKIVIVDNLSTGSRSNLPAGVEFHQLDVSSSNLGELFARHNFDTIIHHAAQVDVRHSMREPASDVLINVVGSLRLMEWSRLYNVGKFIFASTGGAIYGEQDYFPADEQHPVRPVSIYGADKLAVERYLYVFNQDCGLNVVCLRYANVYGPRQNPSGEAGVVAIFTGRMIAGKPVSIHGDGRQTRDYVYVGDVARANVKALDLTGYHVLNIGTGIETDVVGLSEKLSKLTVYNQQPAFLPRQPGEQLRSCINAGLAKRVLKWEPMVGLDEGLKKTVESFKV